MDVSIIIVNYKTPELVVECIRSIREKTTGISYEIIIVDNDSKITLWKYLVPNLMKI